MCMCQIKEMFNLIVNEIIKFCPYYNPVILLIFQKPCLSVCHSADGRILVIGTTEGRFIVLDGKLGSHFSTIQVATGAVDSTKISPGTLR